MLAAALANSSEYGLCERVFLVSVVFVRVERRPFFCLYLSVQKRNASRRTAEAPCVRVFV